jgi:hypothetical protein
MTDETTAGSTETDAEMLQRLGTDGAAWGAEFAEHFGINVDKTRAWFANAIGAGQTEGYSRTMRDLRDAATKLGVDMNEVYTPEYAVEVIHGHGHRSFENSTELNNYLQELCDRGETHDGVPILDKNGVVWLTYGEEHSTGGEYNQCWLLQGDPQNQLQEHELKADDVTVNSHQHYEPIALDEAAYPVILLYAPPAQ